jgi:hypothetical protein
LDPSLSERPLPVPLVPSGAEGLTGGHSGLVNTTGGVGGAAGVAGTFIGGMLFRALRPGS